VEILLICVTLAVGFAAFWSLLGRGEDDPNWELRWRSLDPSYRDWLAAMTTEPRWMKTLTDPEEVRLAGGFARRERRRLARYDVASAAVVALVVALALAGLTSLSNAGFALGLVALIRSFEAWRQRQIRHRVKLGFEPGELPTPLTQPPP
jgi:hypothetical protein